MTTLERDRKEHEMAEDYHDRAEVDYDEPKQAREPEIRRQMDRLDKQAAVMGDSVGRLLDRLESALAPDTPHALTDEPAEPFVSGLGRRLSEVCYRLEGYDRTLRSILGRLEL